MNADAGAAVAAAVVAAILACSDSRAAPKVSAQIPLPDSTVPAGGGGFVLRHVVDRGTTYRYQVFVPKGFDIGKQWPVIVYLAGSGGSGSDGSMQTRGGLGDYLRAHPDSLPAVVVFPQSPRGERGVGRSIYTGLIIPELDSVIKQFNGDPSRVAVVGYSYGASVTYEMLRQFVPRVAALVFISGSCNSCMNPPGSLNDSLTTAVLAPMKSVPAWIFQGRQDNTVSVANTRSLVTALKRMGSPARYTEYTDGAHDIAPRALATPQLLPWLLAQRRSR